MRPIWLLQSVHTREKFKVRQIEKQIGKEFVDGIHDGEWQDVSTYAFKVDYFDRNAYLAQRQKLEEELRHMLPLKREIGSFEQQSYHVDISIIPIAVYNTVVMLMFRSYRNMISVLA